MRIRQLLCVAFVAAAFPVSASAQTIYTWNNTTTGWNTPTAWTPNGVPGGNAGDTAQFTTPTSATINNPVLNSNQSFFQLNFGGTASSGWSLTGTGALTLSGSSGAGNAQSLSQAGLVTRAGSGTNTINLGNGSSTSLTVSGATGTAGGAINVGSSSTLVLTGSTLAATAAANMPITIRGGTLVLDNSAGNPSGQRLTTSNAINLNGGGSTLELRGAAGGTSFSGMTGALGAAGSGDTYLRTVQNGAGALTVNFLSISRVNTSGNQFFENIGTGFVGDAGNASVTFTTAPTTRQGVISTSANTTIPWAAVTSRSTTTSNDVTGRWANYNGGIVAATTTTFTDDFSAAVNANTNIVYAPTSAAPVTLATPSTAFASIVLEPTVAGATLNVGTGLSTYGLLHSGTNDITVNGTNLLSTTGGTRSVIVLSASAALSTNGSLNIASNSNPFTKGGDGFLILTGTTNQIGTTTALGVLNLGGGVLRVNSSNFNLNAGSGVRLNFRGGVLEYDVSGGNAAFNLALGTGANQVSWTSNAGYAAATNVGSGGFSAYAGTGSGNGNTLTVNISGGSTLYWNEQAATNPQLFITDGYALKFGSLRSNSTVDFQNGIALDGSSGNELGTATNTVVFNRTREINVTRGIGNVADRTIISGVISGTGNSDLVKTGTGVLELAANNTYQGNTIVQGGELRISGQVGSINPTGNVVVGNGATLSGTGIITQAAGKTTTVMSGGAIRGDSGTGTGTLTTGSVTLQSGGRLGVQLGAGTAASRLNTSGGVLNLNSGAIIDPNGSFDGGGSRVLATLASGSGALVVGGTNYDSSADIASYTFQAGDTGLKAFGALQIDVTGLNLTGGDQLVLARNANNQLVLTLTPVPEPASLLAVCGLVVGGLAVVRKLRRKGTTQLAV